MFRRQNRYQIFIKNCKNHPMLGAELAPAQAPIENFWLRHCVNMINFTN